jgi:hypothetical protein
LGDGAKQTLQCYGVIAELYERLEKMVHYKQYAVKYAKTGFNGESNMKEYKELELLLIYQKTNDN